MKIEYDICYYLQKTKKKEASEKKKEKKGKKVNLFFLIKTEIRLFFGEAIFVRKIKHFGLSEEENIRKWHSFSLF